MSNQIRGRVHRILPVETNDANGKTYSRQRVIFDCTTYDQFTGEPRSNFPGIEFGGKTLETIAQLNAGDIVTVSFALDGRFHNDRNTGEEKHFTAIRGFKIEVQNEQPSQPPLGATPPPSQYAPPMQSAPAAAEDADDLPF